MQSPFLNGGWTREVSGRLQYEFPLHGIPCCTIISLKLSPYLPTWACQTNCTLLRARSPSRMRACAALDMRSAWSLDPAPCGGAWAEAFAKAVVPTAITSLKGWMRRASASTAIIGTLNRLSNAVLVVGAQSGRSAGGERICSGRVAAKHQRRERRGESSARTSVVTPGDEWRVDASGKHHKGHCPKGERGCCIESVTFSFPSSDPLPQRPRTPRPRILERGVACSTSRVLALRYRRDCIQPRRDA